MIKRSGPCGNSRWRRPKKVNVYLMKLEGDNIYKIGYTSNHPTERIRTIRYYFPKVKLIDFVLCDFENENLFHEMFKKQRSHETFREWFFLSDDDVEFVLNKFKELRESELKIL